MHERTRADTDVMYEKFQAYFLQISFIYTTLEFIEALQDCFRLLAKRRIRHSSSIHSSFVKLEVSLPLIILMIVSLLCNSVM